MSTNEQIRAVNGAIEQASRELKRCKQTCRANGSPIRSITFRVMDDGNAEVSEVAVADSTKTSGLRPPLSLD